jgi:hypothetical protein
MGRSAFAGAGFSSTATFLFAFAIELVESNRFTSAVVGRKRASDEANLENYGAGLEHIACRHFRMPNLLFVDDDPVAAPQVDDPKDTIFRAKLDHEMEARATFVVGRELKVGGARSPDDEGGPLREGNPFPFSGAGDHDELNAILRGRRMGGSVVRSLFGHAANSFH